MERTVVRAERGFESQFSALAPVQFAMHGSRCRGIPCQPDGEGAACPQRSTASCAGQFSTVDCVGAMFCRRRASSRRD